MIVTGRGVSSDGMTLRSVDDLAPYWDGREQLLSTLAAKHPHVRPEDLELPPTHGVEAARTLVEATLAEQFWLTGELRRCRRPSPRHRPNFDMGRLWEAAIRAQMDTTNQSRGQAKQVITAVANQISSLADMAEWFNDTSLRQAAIDETLAYWVLGQDTASSPAQQAWQRLWELRQRPPTLTADAPGINNLNAFRERAETVAPLEDAWLSAWREWVDTSHA